MHFIQGEMESEFYRKKIRIAMESVEGLEEPLKSRAFGIILEDILRRGRESREMPSFPADMKVRGKKIDSIRIDRSRYSQLVRSRRFVLEKALSMLQILEQQCNIPESYPAELHTLIEDKLRTNAGKRYIEKSLRSHPELVDARKEGRRIWYSLTEQGRRYLERRLKQIANGELT